jgi:hypothetical protein
VLVIDRVNVRATKIFILIPIEKASYTSRHQYSSGSARLKAHAFERDAGTGPFRPAGPEQKSAEKSL